MSHTNPRRRSEVFITLAPPSELHGESSDSLAHPHRLFLTPERTVDYGLRVDPEVRGGTPLNEDEGDYGPAAVRQITHTNI